MLVPRKMQPSLKQLETLALAVSVYRKSDATISKEMDDEDGTMLIIVEEDGARSFARFGIDGEMIGDWIW